MPALDRIFPLQAMNVGSANRSRRDPNERVQWTYFRNRFLIENDAAGLDIFIVVVLCSTLASSDRAGMRER
jgi:hypothetical protein